MKRLMFLITLMLPLLTWAHPGHCESEGFTIKHYMVEPEHVLFALLALAVVIFFVGRKKEMHDVEEQKH